MKRLVELRAAGQTAAQTAEILNAEGFLPIDPRGRFTGDMVQDLLVKLGLRGEYRDDSLLSSGEWWIRNLAAVIEVPWQTLRDWALNGWVHGRQTTIQKLWILWADREEVRRLRRLRAAESRGILGYPAGLTTPKPRPVPKEGHREAGGQETLGPGRPGTRSLRQASGLGGQDGFGERSRMSELR